MDAAQELSQCALITEWRMRMSRAERLYHRTVTGLLLLILLLPLAATLIYALATQ